MESKPNIPEVRRVHLADDIEILMDQAASSAYIVWPWWKDSEEIKAAMNHAHSMGFTAVVETGNFGTYTIPEVDCTDWDYAKVVTQ